MKTKTLLLGIISFVFIFGSCEKQEIEQEPIYYNEAVIDTTDNDTVVVDSIDICNDTIVEDSIVAFYNKHGKKLNYYMNIDYTMTICDSIDFYKYFIDAGKLNLLYYWDSMTKEDSIDVYICNKLSNVDYNEYIKYIRYKNDRQERIFIYFDYIVGDSIFYCEKTKRNEPAFSITMNDTIVVSRLSHVVIDSLLNKYPY